MHLASTDRFALLAGSANPALAESVANRLGVAPMERDVGRFPDGELRVALGASVRGRDVYLVQPTAPPVDQNLVELLLLADACRRSGAARLTTMVPYFGYARQERRQGREPVSRGSSRTWSRRAASIGSWRSTCTRRPSRASSGSRSST
jgi:phosphoribosylpyrophosphate synthetase